MGSGESSRRHVPFLGHQLAEYLIAAALAVIALHDSGRPEDVMLLGAGAMVLLAVVSGPPFGAVKLIGKRVHFSLDLVLAAGFALSPLLYLHDLQIIPIVLCELIAFLLVRMSLLTELVPKPRDPGDTWLRRLGLAREHTAAPPPAAAGAPVVAEAPATVGPPPGGSAPSSVTAPAVAGAPETAGKAAGRTVAKAMTVARNSDAPAVAARSLGRATAHARRIGRAAKVAGQAYNAERAAGSSATPQPAPAAEVPPAEPAPPTAD